MKHWRSASTGRRCSPASDIFAGNHEQLLVQSSADRDELAISLFGALYAQDTLRLNPSLTLTPGFRGEFSTGWNEAHGRAANYTFSNGVISSQPRVASSAFTVNNARFLPQPRMGLRGASIPGKPSCAPHSGCTTSCKTRLATVWIRTRRSIRPTASLRYPSRNWRFIRRPLRPPRLGAHLSAFFGIGASITSPFALLHRCQLGFQLRQAKDSKNFAATYQSTRGMTDSAIKTGGGLDVGNRKSSCQ